MKQSSSSQRKMKIVELGKTGIKVQKLGLGAGPFGSIYGDTNEKECGETLKKGLTLPRDIFKGVS